MKNKSKGYNFLQTGPTCEPLSCKKQNLGANLELYNEKRFSVGEIAKFRCKWVCPMSHVTEHDVTMMVRSGYMMSGSPVSWCQADGSWAPQWSQVSCIRYLQVCFLNLEKVFPNSRSCTYPGAVIHGTINPVMFYYKVSQTVTYKCSEVIMTSV